MKKLLIAAVVAAISSGAFAADLKPYIEGQLDTINEALKVNKCGAV